VLVRFLTAGATALIGGFVARRKGAGLGLDLPPLALEPTAQLDKLFLKLTNGFFRIGVFMRGIVVGHPSPGSLSPPSQTLNSRDLQKFPTSFKGLAWPCAPARARWDQTDSTGR
jgi:hypothetical protein